MTGAGLCAAHSPAPLDVRRLEAAAPAEAGAAVERHRATAAQRVRRWREFPDFMIPDGEEWKPLGRARDPRVPGGRFGALPPVPDGTPVTMRVAFLRIDFAADRDGPLSTGTGRFDLTPPDTTQPPIDRPPRNRTFYLRHLEALRRYVDVQTYGQVAIEGDVWPREENEAYTMTDMADFGPWEFGPGIYRAAVHMFRTFLIQADSQSVAMGDRIPWAEIDHVVLIHAGSDLQSDLRRDSKHDIPSFTIGVVDTDRVVLRDVAVPGDSVIVSRGAIIPETGSQDGYYAAINGVLAHECGHLFFGLADLYNIDTGYPVVGFWSLMDSGNNVGSIVALPNGEELFATGLLPPSIDPLQRQWSTQVFDAGGNLLTRPFEIPEMAAGDTVALASSQRTPDFRKVSLSSDEYLLLENRWQAPAAIVQLDQDSLTRVVLGPKQPDRFEYDALLPGGGTLIWHVDESVIPFSTSLRTNPDFGFNSNPLRYGISMVEADGLQDLGDPGSPFLLGSYRDPWYAGNATTLSDTTRPPLRAHTGARPHLRLDVLDPPDSVMRVGLVRTWKLPAWPVATSFPPGGPLLLAVDADGDRALEVCWAGGDSALADSAALFAVRPDGRGVVDSLHVFARLDRRPLPLMAALPTGGTLDDQGPSLFAVSTRADGPTPATPGGRVWLVDHLGVPRPGWPPALPAIVTTPPVIAGQSPTATVFVGCADGRVYALGLDGSLRATSAAALAGGVRGRLAVADAGLEWHVAAAGGDGDVVVLALDQTGAAAFATLPGWPRRVGEGGFEPDFLWLDFDGGRAGAAAPSGCAAGSELVVHHVDRLWAFCAAGEPLPGWGRDYGDTLTAGLGAGDPDADGFAEVLTQSWGGLVAFLDANGHPAPGWPRRGTSEGRLVEDPDLTFPREPRAFPTLSPPLAADVAGDRRPRVVTLNTSGLLVAFDAAGRQPEGWPLPSGAGAAGAPLTADLDRDGTLELVAPDRFGLLYAHRVPGSSGDPARSPWPMLGGDPGRTASLPAARTAGAPAARPGPLVAGSFKAYPNPARQRPVTFAWRLSEPADVEFRILDASGHEVASFTRRGIQSDNVAVWEPGALPAGLYLARVRFRGGGREHVEVVPVGLLR